MIKKFIKKLSQLCMAFLVMVAPAVGSVATTKVYAKTSSDDSSYVSVGNSSDDLFKTNKFDKANTLTLLKKLYNPSSTLTSSSESEDLEEFYNDFLDSLSNNGSPNYKTAEDLRTLNNGKDVNVWFGGLEWTVTYVSKDTSGRPIATLWLANRLSGEDAQFLDRNGDEIIGRDTDWGYENAVETPGVSPYASGWWSSDRTATNPGNMYGTSYIRSIMMGTPYVQGYTDENKQNVSEDDESLYFSYITDENAIHQADIFKPFVSGVYSRYIVSPQNVSWQKTGQHASSQFGWNHDLPNDTWEASTNVSVGGTGGNANRIITATTTAGETYHYYSNVNDGTYVQNGDNMNYSQREHYADWKTDKLWLPSLTEVGYNQDDGVGIWATSEEQRRLVTSEEDEDWPKDYSWLRSGTNGGASDSCRIYPTGDYSDSGSIYLSFALRPALHLNLDSAADSSGIITKVFPNTGVSGTISAVIITIAGIFVIGLLSMTLITTKPKKVIK